MFEFLKPRRKTWPAPNADELRRRARVLVVDDAGFPYKKLFERDGYNIDSWRDIADLAKLESGYYDLILLDIQGVGAKQSADQGFGVLRHLKAKLPTQMVVAYSNADWSLKYKPFFDQADAVLPKTADYVEFKRVVDDLLVRRFSLEFFVDHIVRLTPAHGQNRGRVIAAAERAILTGDSSRLVSLVRKDQVSDDTLRTILSITQVAIGVLQLLVST